MFLLYGFYIPLPPSKGDFPLRPPSLRSSEAREAILLNIPLPPSKGDLLEQPA